MKVAPSNNQGAQKGQKRPRVRLSTFRKSVAYWFGPTKPSNIEELILLGFNVPLQTVVPIFEDMSRRNIARPVIPTKSSAPTRSRDPADTQREKRQKTTQDTAPPSSSQPVQAEDINVPAPNVAIPELLLETREPPWRQSFSGSSARPMSVPMGGSFFLMIPSKPSLDSLCPC